MTGQKTYKEKETEKERGKKRYLERVIEEREADDEIDLFRKPDRGLERVPRDTYKEDHPDFPTREDNPSK